MNVWCLTLDTQAGQSNRQNFEFDAFPSKTLVLVNVIRAFGGIATFVPMLSELLENYDAIFQEIFGK